MDNFTNILLYKFSMRMKRENWNFNQEEQVKYDKLQVLGIFL